MECRATGAGSNAGSRTGRSGAVAGTDADPEPVSGNGSDPGTESKSPTVSNAARTDTGIPPGCDVLVKSEKLKTRVESERMASSSLLVFSF